MEAYDDRYVAKYKAKTTCGAAYMLENNCGNFHQTALHNGE
jgi:hypothetical protein